ncbi:MAG: hypothetical protein GY713_21095 [Actinomycetia bacterium]|nr:hypothetical protein [Actinomycetes bacterium]
MSLLTDRVRVRWSSEPELGDHVWAIWRARWVVLVGSLMVAAGVLVWRMNVPENYEATARVRLVVLANGDMSLDEDILTLAGQIYAELAETQPVLERAIEASGTDVDPDGDSIEITVEQVTPPGFLDVIGSAGSPAIATALADGMSEALVESVTNDQRGSSLSLIKGLTVVPEIVEGAKAPGGPVSPRPIREAGVALLAAMVVLAEGAVLTRSIGGLLPLTETAARVERMVGVPTVSLTGQPEDRTKLALFAARHLTARPHALVVQCGGWPNPAPALRLAEALAIGGQRVLVVDGDMVSPTLDSHLGLARTPGLKEVLRGKSTINDTIHSIEAMPGIAVLTTGTTDNAKWVAADVTRFLGHARSLRRFDATVVSLTSAAMPAGVAVNLGLEIDQAVILVVNPNRTRRRQLGELIHTFGGLDEVGGLLLVDHETASTEIRRLSRLWRGRATPAVANAQAPTSTTSPPEIR